MKLTVCSFKGIFGPLKIRRHGGGVQRKTDWLKKLIPPAHSRHAHTRCNGAADWESRHLVSGPTSVASVWRVIPLLLQEWMNGKMETLHESSFSCTASLKTE